MRDQSAAHRLNCRYVENGSLARTLRDFGPLNEELAANFTAKILEGLMYLHSHGVIHCDLKAANILSTKSGNIKLTDFGVSMLLHPSTPSEPLSPVESALRERERSVPGTPNWSPLLETCPITALTAVAPEIIQLEEPTTAADIWSLGCTIIELVTGRPPWSGEARHVALRKTVQEDVILPEMLSDDLTEFLRLCLCKDPQGRPNAAMLSKHPWITAHDPDLVSSMAELDELNIRARCGKLIVCPLSDGVAQTGHDFSSAAAALFSPLHCTMGWAAPRIAISQESCTAWQTSSLQTVSLVDLRANADLSYRMLSL